MMNKNFKIIKEIILKYEKNEVSLDIVTDVINNIISRKISKEDILEYWGHLSLDELVSKILIEPIEDWESIDDYRALELINELLGNINNNIILERNSEALERRYNKSSGIIIDWIFQEDIVDSQIILERLKNNDIIIL